MQKINQWFMSVIMATSIAIQNSIIAYADIFDKTVTIEAPDDVDVMDEMNVFVGVTIKITTVIGIFVVITGFIKYFQAKGEDNATGESKAGWMMAIGCFFTAMPQIINLLIAN